MPEKPNKLELRRQIKEDIGHHFCSIKQAQLTLADLGAPHLPLQHKMDRMASYVQEPKHLAAAFIWVHCLSPDKVREAAMDYIEPTLKRLGKELRPADFKFVLETVCEYGSIRPMLFDTPWEKDLPPTKLEVVPEKAKKQIAKQSPLNVPGKSAAAAAPRRVAGAIPNGF